MIHTFTQVQHSCGGNTHCDIIIQYTCEDSLPGLRDGYPTGELKDVEPGSDYKQATFQRNNVDGTQTISIATKDDVEFGQHETYEMYQNECVQRERNKGLYVADQKINKNDARGIVLLLALIFYNIN